VPDWDEDSPQLRKNLERVLEEIVQQAEQRTTPSIDVARNWQILIMEGLEPEDGNQYYIGRFRGEPEIEYIQVSIGENWGVDSQFVAVELERFEDKLKTLVAELDALLPSNQNPDEDQKEAVLDLCAWAHVEWLRIHPFANGNGRTARLWANFLAVRYSLPPFVRLRPRPNSGYGNASVKAMHADWKPTAAVFRQLLADYENELENVDAVPDDR
jgi:Fic family protein